MPVRPAHSASSVIRFGTSVRTGMARKRRRLGRQDGRGSKGENGHVVNIARSPRRRHGRRD